MRKSLTLSLVTVAVLFAGGIAYAQSEPRGAQTRAEVEQRTVEMFGRMDVNDDGLLNDADRAAARKQAFDRMDADGNGQVSFAEFETQRDQRSEARAERRGPDGPDSRGFGRGGRGLARAADANSDGTVSQEEFAAAALARFDRADANADGTISVDERREARRQMRRGRGGRGDG